MTMVFLYNTKCSFNKKTGQIEFGDIAWLVPVEAITAVKMTEVPGKKIELHLYADLECQNAILKQHE